MNKNIVISLVIIVVVVSVMALFIKSQNDKLAAQEAASLKSQNQPMDVNPNGGMNNRNFGNPPPSPLACTSVVATTNPPTLPSVSLPHLRFSAQEVISRIAITSTGCTPNDAFLQFVDVVVYQSNSNYTRLSGVNMVDLVSGASVVPYDTIYSFPLVTFRFKPNFDVSQAGTRSIEVRSDLNLDINSLFPGDFIFTVLSNFVVYTSTGNVPVNTGGLSQQTMTY